MMRFLAMAAAAATLMLATGCWKSSEAVRQDEYQKTIETKAFTKFIDTGPSTDGKSVLFVVVKTAPDDRNAVQCSYLPQEPGAPKQQVLAPMSVYRVNDAQPRFRLLSSREAFDLLAEAKTHAGETYRTEQLLPGAPKLYDPFPRDEATGQRNFVFVECREPL